MTACGSPCRKLLSLVLVVLVAVATLAAEGDCEARNDPDTLERPRPTAPPTGSIPEPETTPTALLFYTPTPTAAELTASVEANVSGVYDVQVKYHDANTISIMLLVDTGGQQEPARQIGDNAVRTAKAMVEGGVSSTIGSGAWEYIVGVFEPGDDDSLVVGQKRREEDAIDWNVWDTTMGAPSRQAASTPTPPPPTESIVEPTPTPTVDQALKAFILCERLRLNEETSWGISPSTLQNLDPRFSGTLEPGDYIRILTPESNNGAIRVKVYPHDLRSVNRESNDRVWIDWDILVLQPEYRFDQLVFTCED